MLSGGMTIWLAFRTPDGHQDGFWWKCVVHSCIFYPCVTGQSSFEMSCSFTYQVLAELYLLRNLIITTRTLPSSCRKSSMRKWQNIHCVLFERWFLDIE